MTILMCEKAAMAATLRRAADIIENKACSGAVDIDDTGAGGKSLRKILRGDMRDAIALLQKMDKP